MDAPDAQVTPGDSYCGLYCGACSIFVRTRNGTIDPFIQCCPTMPEGELACDGCKSDMVYAACRDCSIRKCAISKEVARCGDCADFPCDKYKGWQKARFLLPHLREASANLYDIGEQGIERWLAIQRKRWKCPKCETPYSWYALYCRQCGENLRKTTYPLSKIRKAILRVVVRKARERADKQLKE